MSNATEHKWPRKVSRVGRDVTSYDEGLVGAGRRHFAIETSNPRRQHDWTYSVEQKDDIPEDKILIPGVLDSTTNFIEHSKVVAQRILTFTNIVGRDRAIAGTDCGFSTFAGFGAVDPEIVWAKLAALSQGAAMASGTLWGKAA